jgi:hypothetical protein
MSADDVAGWGPLAEPYHSDKQIPPGSPPWRENVFLAFFDRERDVYGTSHFTGASNAGGRRARLSVVVGGTAAEIVEPMAAGEFGTPGVQLDLSGQVRAKSDDLVAELSFVPRLPPVDYSASNTLPGLDDTEPLRHYQGSGTFTGTVAVHGAAPVEVAGGCLRDRTWGWREENRHWLEYYACFLCFEDFDLTLMKFRLADGSTRAHGATVGSRAERVTGSRVARNGWGSVTRFDVELDGRPPIELAVAPPEARIWLPLGEPDGAQALTAYDEFVEARTPDGLTGFGIVEQGILRQLA